MKYENLTASFVNANSPFVVEDIENEEDLLSEVMECEGEIDSDLYEGINVINARLFEISEEEIEPIEGDRINLREVEFDGKYYVIAYFMEYVKDENGEEILFDEEGNEGEVDLFNSKIFLKVS